MARAMKRIDLLNGFGETKMNIANYIKKGIEKILDKSLRFKSFQDYVNRDIIERDG